MIGAWLMALCAVAGVVLALEGWETYRWHHRGAGAKAARSEYTRLRREAVDTAESRLSEAEFIRYYVGARPGATRYVVAAVVLLGGGLPAVFWATVRDGSWP